MALRQVDGAGFQPLETSLDVLDQISVRQTDAIGHDLIVDESVTLGCDHEVVTLLFNYLANVAFGITDCLCVENNQVPL